MSESIATRDLDDLRAEIDRLDAQLLDTLRTRLQVVAEVAEHKRQHQMPMMVPSRVDLVRTRAREFAAAHGISAELIDGIYDLLLSEGFAVEDRIIDGTPTEQRGVAARGLSRHAQRIDHVAIAVRHLDSAIDMFCERYGFELVERRQTAGEVSGMISATLRAGGVTFVLCQGDSPLSNVSRYIEHYGPGVQHVALAVDRQDELLADLAEHDCDLLTDVIHAPGLDQSFTKREPNTGIQLEFVTRTANDGFHDDNVKKLFEAMEREDVY